MKAYRVLLRYDEGEDENVLILARSEKEAGNKAFKVADLNKYTRMVIDELNPDLAYHLGHIVGYCE